MERGQITLFIIAGVFILLVSIGIIYLTSKTSESNITVPSDWVDSIRIYTEECIDQSTMDSVYRLGAQGGHYDLSMPNDYFNMTVAGVNFNFSYVYHNLQQNTDTIQISQMEDELESAMHDYFVDCIDDYSYFPNMDIVHTDPKVQAQIFNSSVKIDLVYRVTIKLEDQETRISDFKSRIIPVRLGYLRDISDNIAKMAITSSSINLSYISNLTYYENMRTVYNTYKNTNQIPNVNALYYLIWDYNSSIRSGNSVTIPSLQNQPFIYAFALDYS